MTTQPLLLLHEGKMCSEGTMQLPLSKSLMARRLVLWASEGGDLERLVLRESDPEDIHALRGALLAFEQGQPEICVGESGTAMRFMLAYLAAYTDRPLRLCGTGRQHERPIEPLVATLTALGARLTYLGRAGYPPLAIEPTQLVAQTVTLDASASSQYLSALMLIAPRVLGTGYTIDTRLSGLASAPYAQMTLAVMQEQGHRWHDDAGLFVYQGRASVARSISLEQEADWTAASYAYQLVALGHCPSLYLPGLCLPSLQGDSLYLPSVYADLGVSTEPDQWGVRLSRHMRGEMTAPIELNCSACPDLVPTIVSSCVALGRACTLKGVAHLRIKESDRLEALRQEMASLGATLMIGSDHLAYSGQRDLQSSTRQRHLYPHGDHRMAMAIAPVWAHLAGFVLVRDPMVVSKSFPRYWAELERLGYQLNWSQAVEE